MRSGSARKRKLTPNGRGWFTGIHVPASRMPEPTISALVFYDRPPEKVALIGMLEQHIWPLYRFSSCVHDGYWVPVADKMDRSYHVSEREVSSEADINSYVQSVMAAPLDHSHPLWTATILRSKLGRSALLLRVHHVISDGLGLLFAFLPVMECDVGNVLDTIPLPSNLKGQSAKSVTRRRGEMPRRSFLGKMCDLLHGSFANTRMFLRGVLSLLIVKADSEIKINTPIAQRTPFLPFSGRHVYTPMPPVPMDRVKALRAKHGCTVNDAIMAALSGAIRRYCIEDLGDPLLRSAHVLDCKAIMLLGLPRPVDPNDPGVSLANNIVTPMFKLPIDDPLPVGRLHRTIKMCDDLKSAAYLAGIQLTTNFILKIAPVSVMRSLASEGIAKCTCNVSNLPLPSVPIRAFGEEVKEFQFLFVNNIPQVSLISYNGFVYWNIVADPELIPDPTALGRKFLEEIEVLAAAAPAPPSS